MKSAAVLFRSRTIGVTAREAPSPSPQAPRIRLSSPARPSPIPPGGGEGEGSRSLPADAPARRGLHTGPAVQLRPRRACPSDSAIRTGDTGETPAPRLPEGRAGWGARPCKFAAATFCKFPLAPSYAASPIRADPLIPPPRCVLEDCPHPRYPPRTLATTRACWLCPEGSIAPSVTLCGITSSRGWWRPAVPSSRTALGGGGGPSSRPQGAPTQG